MVIRRTLVRRGLLVLLLVVAAHQIWRHGHDYVLPRQFAVVEPGKIFRGGWQKDWPMRRIVHDHKIRTVLALAHPESHPLSRSEQALAKELGFRWIHIPIVDQRIGENPKTISDLLDEAAAVLADPANYPIYFHCHHGLNRASMAQIAFRTRYCGWTLEQAMAEIDDSIGLVKVDHGPDYRHMIDYYNERVLPSRNQAGTPPATTAHVPAPAARQTTPTLAAQVGEAAVRPSVR